MLPDDAYYRVEFEGRAYYIRIKVRYEDNGGPESGPKLESFANIRDVRDAATGRRIEEPGDDPWGLGLIDPRWIDAVDEATHRDDPVFVVAA